MSPVSFNLQPFYILRPSPGFGFEQAFILQLALLYLLLEHSIGFSASYIHENLHAKPEN
jgi:hypothetical protein